MKRGSSDKGGQAEEEKGQRRRKVTQEEIDVLRSWLAEMEAVRLAGEEAKRQSSSALSSLPPPPPRPPESRAPPSRPHPAHPPPDFSSPLPQPAPPPGDLDSVAQMEDVVEGRADNEDLFVYVYSAGGLDLKYRAMEIVGAFVRDHPEYNTAPKRLSLEMSNNAEGKPAILSTGIHGVFKSGMFYAIDSEQFVMKCAVFMEEMVWENNSIRPYIIRLTLTVAKLKVRRTLQAGDNIDLESIMIDFLRNSSCSSLLKEILKENLLLPLRSYKNCLVKCVLLGKELEMGRPIGLLMADKEGKGGKKRPKIEQMAHHFVERRGINTETPYEEQVSQILGTGICSGIEIVEANNLLLRKESFGSAPYLRVFVVGDHASLLVERARHQLRLSPMELRAMFDIVSPREEGVSMTVKAVMPSKVFKAMEALKEGKISEPYSLYTFDIETYNVGENRVTYLVGLMNEEYEYSSFSSLKSALAYLASKAKQTVYCFAHNAPFDLAELWSSLDLQGMKMSFRQGKFYSFSFDGNKGKVVLLDSMNYSPTSLASLGALNKKHKKCAEILEYRGSPIRIEEVTQEHLEDAELLSLLKKYNKEDCATLLEWLLTFRSSFLTNWELDPLYVSRTMAGVARTLYWSKFYEEESISTLPAHIVAILSPAYAGGRVECFGHMGEWPSVTYIDANSLYPSVMCGKLPTKFLRTVQLTKAEFLRVQPPERLGFCQCRVRTLEANRIPLLLVKTDKLLFPVFDNWTEIVAYSEELYEGLVGGQYDCQDINFHEFEARDVFSPFVTKLYSSRLEAKAKGDEVGSQINKMAMNSLYGGFGIKPYFNLMEILEEKKFMFYLRLGAVSWYKSVPGGYMCDHKEYRSSPFANVALAASISARGRILLWKTMESLRIRGHQIAYCDTDSIMTTCPLAELKTLDLLSETMLGKFKIVKTGSVFVYGLKSYIFKDQKGYKAVLKGWKGVGKLNSDQARDLQLQLSAGSPIHQEGIRFIVNPKECTEGPRVGTQSRTLKSIYTKGDWDPTTGLITPKHL